MRIQSFKHLPPFDVLAPVNQSYWAWPNCFQDFLNLSTYADVCMNLSWLVSFHSSDYRSFDWLEHKHIELCFCSVSELRKTENRSNKNTCQMIHFNVIDFTLICTIQGIWKNRKKSVIFWKTSAILAQKCEKVQFWPKSAGSHLCTFPDALTI